MEAINHTSCFPAISFWHKRKIPSKSQERLKELLLLLLRDGTEKLEVPSNFHFLITLNTSASLKSRWHFIGNLRTVNTKCSKFILSYRVSLFSLKK